LVSNLLDLAVKAHGGLERWNKVKSVKVAAAITGAIWFVKSKGDALKDIVMTIETKKERLTTDFPGQNKRSVFEPARIVIEKMDGTLIDARNDPEKSFQGHQRETPWDDIRRSLLLWRSTVDLSEHSPFFTPRMDSRARSFHLFRLEGETWRRLKAIIPGARQKPQPRTDLVLWAGRFAAQARLHG
jgi:hypothetical protein